MEDIINISTIGYIVIGIIAGCFYYYILKRHTLGEIGGAIAVGIVGAILGQALISKVFKPTYEWVNQNIEIDLVSTIFGGFLLVWIFTLVSPGEHRSKRDNKQR